MLIKLVLPALAAVALFTMISGNTVTAFAVDEPRLLQRETTYLQELRQVGLYALIEGYVIRQLEQQNLSDELRTLYVLELAKAYAEHATTVSGAEQLFLWKQAEEVLESELQTHPNNTEKLVLEVEKDLIPALRLQHFSRILELTLQPDQIISVIREQAPDVLHQLEQLSKSLAQKVKTTLDENQKHAMLTAYQLQTLQLRVDFQLAQLAINLAQVQTPGSADYSANFLQAETLIQRLASRWTDEPLTQEAWVLWARMKRLRQDEAGYQNIMESLKTTAVPQLIKDRLIAEGCRLYMAKGDLIQAEQLARKQLQAVTKSQNPNQPQDPELQALEIHILRQLAAQTRVKGDTQLAMQLESQADLRTQKLTSEGQLYWLKWLEVQGKKSNTTVLSGDMQKHLQEAQKLYAAGDFVPAALLYKQLAFNAPESREEGFQWALVSLSILAQAKAWSQLQLEAPALCEKYREHPQFPQLDLLLIYAEHQNLPRPWQKDEAAQQHVRHMQEYLSRYGNTPQSNNVRFMLANLGSELGLSWWKVCELYLQIPSNNPQYFAALKQVLRVLDRTINNSYPETTKDLLSQWAKPRWRQLFEELQTPPLTLEKYDLLVQLVRMDIYLLSNLSPYAVLDQRLLAQVDDYCQNQFDALQSSTNNTQSTTDPRPGQPAEVMALAHQSTSTLVLLLCLQQKYDEINKLSARLAQLNTRELISLINDMHRLRTFRDLTTANPYQQSKLELTLHQLIERNTQGISTAEQEQLVRWKSDNLVATGFQAEARQLLRDWRTKHPTDITLALRLIELNLMEGSTKSLEEASSLTQLLESKQLPGSDIWYAYRLQQIELLLRLKNITAAKKLLSVTQLLYPKSGTVEQKAKLKELQKQLP
jgi:hypothetical protein